MRKVLRIATPLALAVLMSAAPAHAGSQSGTYVAATGVSSTAGGRCVAQVGQCVALMGGFQIPAGPTAINLKITDVSGPGTPITVCQRNGTTQPLCGDSAGDVRFVVCAPATSKTYSGFKTTAPINVFIFSARTSCDGVGTTGSYSATWT